MYIDYWPLLLCIELKSTGNPTEQNTPFIDTHPAHVTTNSEASTTEEKKEKKKRKRLKHCREWVSVGWGERNEYVCVHWILDGILQSIQYGIVNRLPDASFHLHLNAFIYGIKYVRHEFFFDAFNTHFCGDESNELHPIPSVIFLSHYLSLAGKVLQIDLKYPLICTLGYHKWTAKKVRNPFDQLIDILCVNELHQSQRSTMHLNRRINVHFSNFLVGFW